MLCLTCLGTVGVTVSALARSSAALLRGGRRSLGVKALVTENPLLLQESLPLFSAIEAVHVKDAVSGALSSMESEFESLESRLQQSGDVSYSAVIEELEKLEAPVEYSWGVVNHLMGVKNSDELRAAHGEVQGEVVKTTTKLSQSEAVFKALEALEKDGSLEPAQQRIVQSSLSSMRLSGVGLQGEEKERFNANRIRLSELSTAFSNNLLDATKAFSLTLTEPAQVDGLPPSALALAASRAAEEGEEGATAESGPWRLGLDMPSYLPAMKFLRDRSVREALYRAFVTRAGEVNAPLIRQILQIKQEQASILGFGSYAEVSIERKMAPSVEAVYDLTEMLLAKAYPAAQKELQQLTEFATANGFDGAALALWDVSFWSERLSEHTFGFEQDRPLAPPPRVCGEVYLTLPHLRAGGAAAVLCAGQRPRRPVRALQAAVRRRDCPLRRRGGGVARGCRLLQGARRGER